MPIDPNSVKWDAPPKIDEKSIVWDGQKGPATTIGQVLSGDFVDYDRPKRALEYLIHQQKNLLPGAVRGAGSIGRTILTGLEKLPLAEYSPLVALDRAVNQYDERPGLKSLVTGEKPVSRDKYLRGQMDSALQQMGADPDSLGYGTGKLGAEIAGTSGVGGVLAKGVQSVAPAVPFVQRLAEALRTSGMSVGPGGNYVGNLLTRIFSGATTGGTSAALIDPNAPGLFGMSGPQTAAVISGAAPPVIAGAGKVGQAIGRALSGPAQTPEMQAAVKTAQESGYVIPPTQAKPSLLNRITEGFAGKLTTAQNASAKNQPITNRLAAQEIGIPDGIPLNLEALDTVRAEAGKAYSNISGLGKIDVSDLKIPSGINVKSLTQKSQPAPGVYVTTGTKKTVDAADLVESWKQANRDATAYYRAYARDANPETLAKAKNASKESAKIDDFLSSMLDKIGKPELKKELNEARVLIAKTHTVEKALNPITGNVDAAKLAGELKKGKPLSGGLKKAGEFAGQFKTAVKVPENMGSLPQTSPLDYGLAGLALLSSGGNPLSGAALLARPAAREFALSGPIQSRLAASQSPNKLAELLSDQDVQQLIYRSLPATASSR